MIRTPKRAQAYADGYRAGYVTAQDNDYAKGLKAGLSARASSYFHEQMADVLASLGNSPQRAISLTALDYERKAAGL